VDVHPYLFAIFSRHISFTSRKNGPLYASARLIVKLSKNLVVLYSRHEHSHRDE